MSIHPPHAIVNEENKMKDSNNSSNYRVISNAAFPFCIYSSDSEALGKINSNYLSFKTFLEIIQITAKRKLERLQFSTSLSFVKI